ncbi:MAG: site-specific DNA-methyltransferase [Deltaproteobacteria bacterium]|nr:site-specific DNA-methyltransferase [Deltaproteobacteria bacterium]
MIKTQPTPAFAITHADAVQWLRSVPSGAIDLVVTDPPYESLEKHRATGTTTRLKQSKASSNAWFDIFPNSRFDELFAELFRVLHNDSHLYLFCDHETMRVAVPLAEARGFKFWKPIVWDKIAIGMGYHYRCRYEFILFFEKGKRKLNDLSVPDVLCEKRVHNGYPTEKPAPLIEVLVNNSTEPGEIVCDPFCGSGSAGVAALRHGRQFVGADLSTDAIALATQRLRDNGGQEGVKLVGREMPQLALLV